MTETPNGGSTTDLYYSAQWQVLEEKVGANTAMRYVWSPVYVDALVLRERDTDANGTLDERLYALQDANFNVVALVNTSGTVVERYAYDPFGAVSVMDASYGARGSSSYGWTVLFQGMDYDATAALYHQRMRCCSPTLSRWVTNDPLMYIANDNNLYRFVDNNPTVWIDPSGLVKIEIRFKPLPKVAGKLGIYHVFVVVTDENGEEYFYRAGPSGNPGNVSEASSADNKKPVEEGWGCITTNSGEYKDGNTKDYTTDKIPSITVLDNNDPAQPYKDKLDNMLSNIEKRKMPYKPTGPNSNSVAHQMVNDLGIKVPKPHLFVIAPGFTTPVPATPQESNQP